MARFFPARLSAGEEMNAPTPGFSFMRDERITATHVEDRYASLGFPGTPVLGYCFRIFEFEITPKPGEGQVRRGLYGEVWAEWALGLREVPALAQLFVGREPGPEDVGVTVQDLADLLLAAQSPGWRFDWEGGK